MHSLFNNLYANREPKLSKIYKLFAPKMRASGILRKCSSPCKRNTGGTVKTIKIRHRENRLSCPRCRKSQGQLFHPAKGPETVPQLFQWPNAKRERKRFGDNHDSRPLGILSIYCRTCVRVTYIYSKSPAAKSADHQSQSCHGHSIRMCRGRARRRIADRGCIYHCGFRCRSCRPNRRGYRRQAGCSTPVTVARAIT